MSTTGLSKTDFIKFNVSPTFKQLAAEKAKAHGMTLSELGRMLFGVFVTGVGKPRDYISTEFLKMAERAKEKHRKGLTKSFANVDKMMKYLDSL